MMHPVPSGPTGLTATSAEFVRQFGHWRQHLGSAPLFVTHHGRPTHVFLTVGSYRALEGDAIAPREAPADGLPAVEEIAGWMRAGLIVCDREFVIKLANEAALGIAGRSGAALVGHRLWDVLPELEGSLAQIYIRRTAQGGGRSSAELPAMFRPDTWIRLDVVPFSQGVALLLADISDDVRHHRLADARQALVDAISQHPAIGHGRLNVRGEIERCDATMCALLALPEERLRHVPFADLATPAARPALREAIGRALRDGTPCTIDTELHANSGSGIPVSLSLTELRGAYGVEGAVLVLTRRWEKLAPA